MKKKPNVVEIKLTRKRLIHCAKSFSAEHDEMKLNKQNIQAFSWSENFYN